MRLSYARVLTLTAALAAVPLAGCDKPDTSGGGGGQISGDAKVVGEDVREQIPPNEGTRETAGTTPAAGDASTVRTGDVNTGSEGSDAGPVNSGTRQAERQENR